MTKHQKIEKKYNARADKLLNVGIKRLRDCGVLTRTGYLFGRGRL